MIFAGEPDRGTGSDHLRMSRLWYSSGPVTCGWPDSTYEACYERKIP